VRGNNNTWKTYQSQAKECTHKYECFALGRNAPLKLSQDVLIGLFGLSGSNFRHEGCDPDPPSQ
jgi:hypothetical protein